MVALPQSAPGTAPRGGSYLRWNSGFWTDRDDRDGVRDRLADLRGRVRWLRCWRSGLAAYGRARRQRCTYTSGLPVPRFVSIKSDHVTVRGGPDKDQDVAWVYTRRLPVEITAEFENWRRIRDSDGSEGWVYHSLLSGKRTAFVAKSKNSRPLLSPLTIAPTPMRRRPRQCWNPGARRRETMQRPMVPCPGEGFDGWIEQAQPVGRLSQREDGLTRHRR